MNMTVHIKNLRLRAIIGVNDWERDHPQDVTVNVKMEFDATKAAASDDLNDTIDYQAAKHRIMDEVENSNYFLIERLAAKILDVVMADPKVLRATVEVDKPHALRFAESVSVTCSAQREP